MEGLLVAHGVGIFVALLMAGCVAALYLMRDPVRSPRRTTRRQVWCERHHCRAEVDFAESTTTGITDRSVVRCSMRPPGEHCGQTCRNFLSSPLSPS